VDQQILREWRELIKKLVYENLNKTFHDFLVVSFTSFMGADKLNSIQE